MLIANVYIEHSSMALNKTFAYLCDDETARAGMRVLVPFAYQKQLVGFIASTSTITTEQLAALPYKLKKIIQVIDNEPYINDELFSLAKWMSKSCCAPIISCLQTMLPAKLKAKTTKLKIKQSKWISYINDNNLTQRQRIAIDELKENEGVMLLSLFRAKHAGVMKKLLEHGCIKCIECDAKAIINKTEVTNCKVELNADQLKAINCFKQSEQMVSLLFGVTGSGKSEVYLQLAQHSIDEGKQVLILVPEISLTSAMMRLVANRFGNEVAIYHSGLNNQEKYEQFKLVYNKEVNIVVGTRSAVFMPFTNLGLIVIDEEHDNSYKQGNTPAYHTRDVAIQRCINANAKLLLASATPCLESYARALKGVYNLISMPKRIHNNYPSVKLVNMKEAIKNNENYIISNSLKEAIRNELDDKKQILILLNRRGYTPVLRCSSCGYVAKCPHCDISLNYHKVTNQLVCHSCGYSTPMYSSCPSCQHNNFRYLGTGTQRCEELLKQMFPHARIARMDADTTNRKGAHANILQSFENYEADILLGTQMIAKGLDIPRITLVGILNADSLINRSDYRSVEVMFDMLVQASGRCGRNNHESKVIMQVYEEDHYAIQLATKHDYIHFFKKEMEYRHSCSYPPYTYLATIMLYSLEDIKLNEVASSLKEDLDKYKEFKVLGPVKLGKIKDEKRIRIMIKCKDIELLQQSLYKLYEHYAKISNKVKVNIDINPVVVDS
ncbi:MAG: primosomal protein N' [Erysipelotrichaceae bacterium]